MNNKDKTTKTHKKVNRMNDEELKTARDNCLSTQGGLESKYGREVEFYIGAADHKLARKQSLDELTKLTEDSGLEYFGDDLRNSQNLNSVNG